MKQTMNREVCQQIDARLATLFDSIPDASSKTPEEFFSEIFSDKAKSEVVLGKNEQRRTFVHKIMASKMPEAEEMALAILRLALTTHRHLDGLINTGGNPVALACESGSHARIEGILRTGYGRGRLANIDDQGNLEIFHVPVTELPRLENFFRDWRSVGKNKSLFDYVLDEKVGPDRTKVSSTSWDILARIFPEKIREINQYRAAYNPDLLVNAYRLGGIPKLERALDTNAGVACLTEVDAQGKLKIFGSDFERLSQLEEFFRKLRFDPNDVCLLDLCLQAASRTENPTQFHPSVWQVLRKIFVADIKKIQVEEKEEARRQQQRRTKGFWPESTEAQTYHSYDYSPESASELSNKTENDLLNGFEESLTADTPEANLRAFAVDASGRTPLHLAAEQGNVALVEKILASEMGRDSVYINTAALFRSAHLDCLAKMLEDPTLVKLASHTFSISDYNYKLVKELSSKDSNIIDAQMIDALFAAGNTDALRAVAEINRALFVSEATSYVRLWLCPSDTRLSNHTGYYDEKTFPKLKKLFELLRDNAPEHLGAFFAIQGGNGLGVMHYAANVGDVAFVRAMYATDAGKVAIKAPTVNGATPLRIAITRGKQNVAIVEELLTYPEVIESVCALDKDDRNIFHLFENSNSRVHPEVLKVILRKAPESRKLLSQKTKDQRSPISLFTAEHLQSIVDVANESPDSNFVSGCEADLITLSIRSKNLALLPAIAATEAGQAALRSLDSEGCLPLRRAMCSEDLDIVKQLLQYPAVQESIETLNDKNESIFNSVWLSGKPITPEILRYVLETYPQSRKLLSGTAGRNPLADFSIPTLKVAIGYAEGAEALFAKASGELCFAQDVIKSYSSANQHQYVGSKEKAQAVIDALKTYPDRDKARTIFTQKINGKKFIDTLTDEQRALIPVELLTLELDLGTIAAFVGMIRCAASTEQARAVLNAPDENGLSVYSRLSPEQRAILDTAFAVSPAVSAVLAATSVSAATTANASSTTSLQSGAHGDTDGAVVAGVPTNMKKRSSADDLREREKSPRTGNAEFSEGR